MAGIIASVADDIRKLQELKQAIADIKGELKGINIKVDIDIKENLEKQLQSLMSQYNAVAARISEVEGKLMILRNDVQKTMEAQGSTSDMSKLITDGLKAMEQSEQSAAQAVESLNDTLESNRRETEHSTQALNENAEATERVRLTNAQLASEINKIANTDYDNFVIRATNGTVDYSQAVNKASRDIARLTSIQMSLSERFQAEEIGIKEYNAAMNEAQAAIERTKAASDSLRDTRSGSMGGNVDTSGLEKLDENIHILLLNLAELEVENGKTKQSLKDLNKAFKDGNITEEDYIRKKAIIQNSLDEEAKAIRDVKTELKLQRQAVGEVEGSYNQLSAQYGLNKIILNKLTEEQLQDTEEYNTLLKETEAIYERMNQYQASTGKHQLNVGNYPSFSDSFKDVGNVEGLKERFEEANIAIGEMQTSIGNLSQANMEYVAKGQELRSEISELTSSLNDAMKNGMPVEEQSQAIETIKSKIQEYGSVMMQSSAAAQAAYELQQDSVKALESELSNLQIALQTALAGGNAESADALAQEIANVSSELTKAKERLEELSVAAQNAKESFNGVAEEQAKMTQSINAGWLDKLRDGFNSVGNSVSEYTSKIINAATGNGKFQQNLSSFKDGLNQLPIPLGKSVDGVIAMTRAMWAMVATPIGAVLAAIVLSLQALFQWLTKDADGQRAFAKASAYLGSILSTMTDIVVAVGKYLYHAFADAGAPLNSFAKSLKTTFVSAVKTVSELVGGLGNTLKGIFTMDWSTFKDGVSQMGKGLLDAGKTMVSAVETTIKGVVGNVKLAYNAITDDNLAKDISKHWNDAIPKAKESAELAERETNARIEAQKAQERAAKLDAEIAKKREEIYTLTGKAKDAAIEEAKALMKARYDDQIKVQKEQLDILKAKNSLHTSSLEDLAKERDLNIQLLRTQAQREASTRMMTRMQQSNLNKMKTQSYDTTDTKWEETLRKNANERIKVEMDIEDLIIESRIKAMEEGAEKVRAERERQNEKEIEDIKRQRDTAIEAERNRQKAEFDAEQAVIKKMGGKAEKWDESKVDETFIKKIKEQYEKIYNNTREAQEKELVKAELTAMRDYLKEYGTFQQQKLAIAQEYAEKISKAQTEGERKSLEKERDKNLQNISDNKIVNQIDWVTTFGKLGTTFDDLIKNALTELNAYVKTDEFKSRTAEEQKTILDAQNQLQGHVANDATFDKLNKQIEVYRQNLAELKALEDVHKTAIEARMRAEQERDKIEDKGSKEYEEANQKVVAAMQEEERTADIVMTADNAVAEAQYAVADTASKLQTNLDNFSTGLNQLTSGTLAGTVDGLTNLFKSLGMSDDIMKGFKDTLETGLSALFGEQVGSLLAGSLDLVEGFLTGDLQEAIISGVLGMIDNILDGILKGGFITKPVKALVGGLGNIANTITFGGFDSWFGIGGNKKEVEETINKLTERNEILTDSIDRLTDELGKTSGMKAVNAADKAKKQQEEKERNLLDMMKAQMSYWNSHHSFNAYWKGFSKDQIADFAEQIGRPEWDGNLTSLTADEAAKLLENPEMVEIIKNTGKGGYGSRVLEKLKDYAAEAGVLLEIEEQLNESLTQTSFDSLRSDFINSLMDMKKNAKDFSEDFTKMLMQSVLNARIADEMEDALSDFYKDWAKRSEDGLDDRDIEALKAQWDDIVQAGITYRDEVAAVTGYDKISSEASQQTASGKGFQTMSQDTGEELNGRFTAMYESDLRQELAMGEQTTAITAIKDSMLSLYSKVDSIGNIADDTRTIIADSYLELVQISENTGNSAKYLKDIKADIAEVKRNTSRL